jgi:hypothetical protein
MDYERLKTVANYQIRTARVSFPVTKTIKIAQKMEGTKIPLVPNIKIAN